MVNGGDFTPRSEALIRAMKKYEKEKIDQITLRVPKGKREIIQKHAAEHGESLNRFINRAIDMAIATETSPNKEK